MNICKCGCETVIPDNHTYYTNHTGNLSTLFDLSSPQYCYLFGFLQADGTSEETRTKGRVRIELNYDDEGLLSNFQQILPVNTSLRSRTRDTNFKESYKSAILSICNATFREKLKHLGLMPGKKSALVKPPEHLPKDGQKDYLRGLIDGDGSLGITSNNRCFISLTTSSDLIKDFFMGFILEKTQKKKRNNRNTRDNAYNIVVFDEDAQTLCRFLYYPDCMALKRKKESAEAVRNWTRPATRIKRSPQKGWTNDQDQFILNHSVDESMGLLKRSKSSIKTRLWRLSKINE